MVTTAPPAPAVTSQVPPLTPARALVALLFLLWLEAGYTASLVLFGRLPLGAALWQAAACLALIPPLLFLVVKTISLPKVGRFPRWAVEALWVAGNVSQLVLPWLGWSTFLWLCNGGAWGASLRPGAGVAVLSYLTGLLILALLYPRPRGIRVTRLELPIPGLPEAFDGFAVLHVSDLHCCYFAPARVVRARLARAAELDYDLLAFTGDTADGPETLAAAAEALGGLATRVPAFAVLGNHDNWVGAARVRRELTAHGFRMLVNEHLALSRGEQRLYLAGVNNTAYNDRDDLPATLAGLPEEAAVLLLSHAPNIIRRPLSARAALILTGHTHGGQLVLPLLGPLYVPSSLGRHYASGLFRHPGGWLFINRGLGEIFPPIRLLCPPELALITLRRESREVSGV